MRFSARFEAALLEQAEHSAADLRAAAHRWVGAAFQAAAHNAVDRPVAAPLAEAAVVAGVAAAERHLT